MPVPSVGVRPARTSDVDDIADVQLASWRERFATILPAGVLDGLQARDVAGTWATSILLPPTPGHRVLVAVEDDRTVGFAAIGPAADPDTGDRVAELVALEVAPAAQRRGHGSRLLAAAVDHARALSCTEVVIWYPLADETRRAFLASAGWGPDGAFRDISVQTSDTDEPALVREVRLVTALPAAG